jgi:hypothetical protein
LRTVQPGKHREIDVTCDVQSALLTATAAPPDVRPAAPPPPTTRDARGLGPHLIIRSAGHSRTDDSLVFGADPGTYRLRLGWVVGVHGGGGAAVTNVIHQFFGEPVPYTETFWLTVLAPSDQLLVLPSFDGTGRPAPYTFLRVLRGVVVDETNTAVPLFQELTLSAFYWTPAGTLYQLGLRI